MASCLGWRSSVQKYGQNHCFHPLFGTGIRVSLFVFLLWAPALLQNLAPPFNPKFLGSYFNLCAFIWSVSGHRPHFELFRFLFHLKPQPDFYVLDVVGGEGLQLRQRKDRVYIPYSLSNKVIEWNPKWFYVENQWESVPAITPGPPIQCPEWNKKPVDEGQLPELLARIADLRQKNMTREAVMFDWMKKRIQPL